VTHPSLAAGLLDIAEEEGIMETYAVVVGAEEIPARLRAKAATLHLDHTNVVRVPLLTALIPLANRVVCFTDIVLRSLPARDSVATTIRSDMDTVDIITTLVDTQDIIETDLKTAVVLVAEAAAAARARVSKKWRLISHNAHPSNLSAVQI
jgi:hypothetical protein